MSALPAEITELSEGPVRVHPTAARSQLRTERRAEQARALQVRRRWSIFGLVILGCSFGLTIGVLDVLH